jgi:hypothetical protein
MLDTIAKAVQVLSIVAGVVISVLSFNDTRNKEAEARVAQAEAARLESAKPFLELRQKLYMETLKAAGVLSSPDLHDAKEIADARKRFRELYVTELSMVECPNVEMSMRDLAEAIDKDVTQFTEAQSAAFQLAHALRDSFVLSWEVQQACK